MQITVSRRQHVRVGFGVREPSTNTAGRIPQVLFYVLWDRADGKLWEGLAMKLHWPHLLALTLILTAIPAVLSGKAQTENAKGDRLPPGTVFRTSDRCVA